MSISEANTSLNIFQFIQVNQLQSEKSSLENHIVKIEQKIDDLIKADLKLIDAGFVGENFTGIVYNRGLLPANNAEVILHTGSTNNERTCEINIGEVD